MEMRILFLISCFLFSLASIGQSEITTEEIEGHIAFLASPKMGGRFPGEKSNKKLVRYLEKNFKAAGLQKLDGTYKQAFEAKIRVKDTSRPAPIVKTWNVMGVLPGSDPILKDEYLVLGAHYDHLGMGGPSSKSKEKNKIHFGADDNASGTAALLEIAEKLAAGPERPKRSIIFVAFGAEEQGLLGSRYFVSHLPVPKDQVKLMINMDMVGRLNAEKHVYMGGAGTFPKGMETMKDIGESLGLTPIVHAGSVGGSDHVPFYRAQISVLGMHTGGHPQYHTPEDTLEHINLVGEQAVCNYIAQALLTFANRKEPFIFIAQD